MTCYIENSANKIKAVFLVVVFNLSRIPYHSSALMELHLLQAPRSLSSRSKGWRRRVAHIASSVTAVCIIKSLADSGRWTALGWRLYETGVLIPEPVTWQRDSVRSLRGMAEYS